MTPLQHSSSASPTPFECYDETGCENLKIGLQNMNMTLCDEPAYKYYCNQSCGVCATKVPPGNIYRNLHELSFNIYIIFTSCHLICIWFYTSCHLIYTWFYTSCRLIYACSSQNVVLHIFIECEFHLSIIFSDMYGWAGMFESNKDVWLAERITVRW